MLIIYCSYTIDKKYTKYNYDISVGADTILSSNQGLEGWTFSIIPAEIE